MALFKQQFFNEAYKHKQTHKLHNSSTEFKLEFVPFQNPQ